MCSKARWKIMRARACHPRQLVWRPAGNFHEAVAPNGAIILGFFLKANRFAAGKKILHGGSAAGFTAPTPADHGSFQP